MKELRCPSCGNADNFLCTFPARCGICNTTVYGEGDREKQRALREVFEGKRTLTIAPPRMYVSTKFSDK